MNIDVLAATSCSTYCIYSLEYIDLGMSGRSSSYQLEVHLVAQLEAGSCDDSAN